MKIKFNKSAVLKHKQRGVVALLWFVCLTLLIITTGTAQLRSLKHVMALQLGEAAEGSRVTVVSDAPLNDYEAYRRGDHFYVKIPLADLGAAFPQLRADGFENVQVQKVGENVFVSFKLEVGATARVEQHANQLTVIFSAANRSTRSRASSVSSTSRTPPDRGPDAAGPMPGASELANRQRVVTERTADGFDRRTPNNSRGPINPSVNTNQNSNKAAALTNNAAKSPSPIPTPTSVLSPPASNTFPPLAVSSPAPSPRSTVAVNSAGPSASAGSQSWRKRGNAAMQWMSANRLATLLGALILLSLILYLVLGLRRRGKDGGKAKRLKALQAQPKVQPKVEPGISPEAEMHEVATAAPAVVASTPYHSSELTKPSIAAPTAVHHELREEEEREVFEL